MEQPSAEEVDDLRRALFDAQTRTFVLENQVADLAGGRDAAEVHEELLSTRKKLEEREHSLLEVDRRAKAYGQQVRELKELLVKARGSLASSAERENADAEARRLLEAELEAATARAEATRAESAKLQRVIGAAGCTVECLTGALEDVDAEYDQLYGAHRDFTAEVDALRCTSSRTAAHERGALAEAQAELTRLRLDASGQRGRIAALQAEATKLRAQLGAAETKAADAASSGASAAEAAAKFEVQARTVGEELTALKAQLARAHADGDGRARQLAEATSSLERERASLEALERRAEREAQVLQAKLDDASAELSRREQRCAHLQQQLEGALGEGREARAAVEAARRHGAGEGAAHAIELRTLGAELAVLETSCARVDERVATQVEQESAKAAAATARAEHEAAHKTAALESQLAKTSAQLKVAERKLGEATHRLGAAQRHGTQLRAAQEQLAELRAALDKKTALCERLLKRQSAFHPAAPSAHADAGPDDDGRTGPRGASLGGGGGKENARSDGLPSPRLAEQPRSAHARSGPLRRPNFAAPSSSTAKGAAPAARTAFRSRPALRPGGAASAPSTPKRETRSPASARPAPSPRLEVSTGNDSPCHGGSEQDAAAPDLDCASEASLGAAGPRPRRKSGVKVVPSRYMESALAASSNRRRSSEAGLAA